MKDYVSYKSSSHEERSYNSRFLESLKRMSIGRDILSGSMDWNLLRQSLPVALIKTKLTTYLLEDEFSSMQVMYIQKYFIAP